MGLTRPAAPHDTHATAPMNAAGRAGVIMHTGCSQIAPALEVQARRVYRQIWPSVVTSDQQCWPSTRPQTVRSATQSVDAAHAIGSRGNAANLGAKRNKSVWAGTVWLQRCGQRRLSRLLERRKPSWSAVTGIRPQRHSTTKGWDACQQYSMLAAVATNRPVRSRVPSCQLARQKKLSVGRQRFSATDTV